MKAARLVIKISGIFSLVQLVVGNKLFQFDLKYFDFYSQIMSVLTGTLAVLAILAYNCVFRSFMQKTPLSYMWYLLYFKSSKCDRSIYWYFLGVYDSSFIDPGVPDETVAVFRTFILACFYFAVSVLLLITSIQLLRKFSQHGLKVC